MSYLKENFLLTNKAAEKLYRDYAENMPIFDYHCHLSKNRLRKIRNSAIFSKYGSAGIITNGGLCATTE